MLLQSRDVRNTVYLLGMAKSAQQKLQYNLYGSTNNQFNEKVVTGPELHPDQLVKVHLGLVGVAGRARRQDLLGVVSSSCVLVSDLASS